MQMPNQVPDSILEKIQKLINLRDSPGTPEEGAAAAGMINNLLLRYNLEMSQVLNHKVSDKNVISLKLDLNELQDRHDANFGVKLVSAICYFNFCRCITTAGYRTKYDQGYITLVGQSHNIEIVKYMIDYCQNNIISLEKAYWKRYTGEITNRNTYKRGFYQGCIDAIVMRLHHQKEETVEQTAKEQNVTVQEVEKNMSVMVIKNTEAVDKRVEELFPRLKAGKAHRNLMGRDGQIDGREAGQKLNLAQGLNGSSSAGQIGR